MEIKIMIEMATITINKKRKVYLNPSKIIDPWQSAWLLTIFIEFNIGDFMSDIRYATDNSIEEITIEKERL